MRRFAVLCIGIWAALLSQASVLGARHLQDASALQPVTINTQLPASAVNLGLGATAFPNEGQNDLPSLVGSNITLFLEQTFGSQCKVPNCGGIANALWSMLVDGLTSASQGTADPSVLDTFLSKLNEFFYIFQPWGVSSTPADLVNSIESLVPSPTPDPTFPLITDIQTATNMTDSLLQKITGFMPPAEGFGQVLQMFFGNVPTTDGAAAAASGAAGG